MFKLQGCPRCHGDLYIGEDIYGVYLNCIQCGRHFPAAAPAVRARRPAPAASPAGPPVPVAVGLAA